MSSDVVEVRDLYDAASGAARRAVDDGSGTGDVVDHIAPAGEWDVVTASYLGDIVVQGALWGAVDALRARGVSAPAVMSAGTALRPAASDPDDWGAAAEWLATALEPGNDPYATDDALATEMVHRWERGTPRVRSLVVAIVDVATRAAAARRSAS
ncbi:hypothetical protein [Clavibacter tessellarius]|uniref:hypothetical protein n=1 Tax=Clavibacter tessellarius TaxID=31965 RepID=UPI00324CBCBA